LSFFPGWRKADLEARHRMSKELAAIVLDAGDLAYAERLLSTIRSTSQVSHDILFLKGMVAYRKHLATDALQLFEQALLQQASEPKYLNAVGYILTESNKDLKRARSLLERAYDLFRCQPNQKLADLLAITHSLGRLYSQIGELEKAQKLLTLAFSQCPPEWKSLRQQRNEDLQKFLMETGRKSLSDQ